jgi:hypothetical protein
MQCDDLDAKYKIWGQQRNQALWRKEDWSLPFLDWVRIWGSDYQFKGQDQDSLCMTRRDLAMPWTEDNVVIISRRDHFASNRNKIGRFATREEIL